MSAASTEAWAAALAWPFTQRPDWWLAPGIVGLGLPFAPFALLAASGPVREGWGQTGQRLLSGWVQVAIACLVVGTIVPGLSQAARVPALAGILMIAATGLEAAWTGRLSARARHLFLVLNFSILTVWLATLLYGGYVWTLVLPYYRPLGIVTLLLGMIVLALGWSAVETSKTRRAIVRLAILSASLKLVHWGSLGPAWT